MLISKERRTLIFINISRLRARVKFWLRNPHNRDHEGYANAGDLHRIISTATQGDIRIGSDIMRLMVSKGILEHHEKTRGLIRLESG